MKLELVKEYEHLHRSVPWSLGRPGHSKWSAAMDLYGFVFDVVVVAVAVAAAVVVAVVAADAAAVVAVGAVRV